MKCLTALLLVIAAVPAAAVATAIAPIPAPNYSPAPTTRDGRNDFNFEFGTWRTHYRLLKRRLVGNHEWYDCYGTSVIRPFWNRMGNLEDGDLKCPTRYVGGLTLRLYDAQSHQWTLWWGTRKLGVAPPQQVGHFDANGVGRFYAHDVWQGRPIICRFQWTVVNGNPHFEQAFSTDGGKSWETNWTTDYVRVPASSAGVWNAPQSGPVARESFDFLIGTWKTHYMRRRQVLADDNDWYSCDGTSVVTSFWTGSGNLEDGDLRCPSQYIHGVTLRLYDGATHQWLLYWGTQKRGLAVGLPQIGKFGTDGVGDFYAPDTVAGHHVIVRYRWMMQNGNPRYEEAFSTDHGKTWETEWTTDYRPAKTT